MSYCQKQQSCVTFCLLFFSVSCFFSAFIASSSLPVRNKLLRKALHAIANKKKIRLNKRSSTDLVLLICEERISVIERILPKVLHYLRQQKKELYKDEVMKRAIEKGQPKLVEIFLKEKVYHKEALVRGKALHLYKTWSWPRKLYFFYEAYCFSFLPSFLARLLNMLSMLYYGSSFFVWFFSIKNTPYTEVHQILKDLDAIVHFGIVKKKSYRVLLHITYLTCTLLYLIYSFMFYAREMSYLHLVILSSASQRNKLEMLQLFLKKGANPNAKALIAQRFSLGVPELDRWLGLHSYWLLTPLLLAHQKQEKRLFEQLLKAGAQPLPKKKRVHYRDKFRLDPEKKKFPLSYVSFEKILCLVKLKG